MSSLRFNHFLVLLIVVALCQPVWPAPAAAVADSGLSLADFEKSVTEFTLANGMKFVVVERHLVPVVAFDLYVDVGGVDESTGLTGVSHLFEHMAFKGTRSIGTRDYVAEKKAFEIEDAAYTALQ